MSKKTKKGPTKSEQQGFIRKIQTENFNLHSREEILFRPGLNIIPSSSLIDKKLLTFIFNIGLLFVFNELVSFSILSNRQKANPALNLLTNAYCVNGLDFFLLVIPLGNKVVHRGH